jgi:hypothetical protein
MTCGAALHDRNPYTEPGATAARSTPSSGSSPATTSAENFAWGFLGAVIATLATFVPCFVLIISGAPIIDRIRSTGSFANSLSGVTISVVGVIGGLAVFVARHALITNAPSTGRSPQSPRWRSSPSGATGSASSDRSDVRRRGHHQHAGLVRSPAG